MTTRQRAATLLSQVLEVNVDPAAEFTREDAASWDSMGHLRLLMAFEEEFGITLDPDEMISIESLSDLERIASGRGAR